MEDAQITLARAAYARYGAVTDFKNFRGEPMPEWEQLPEKIQQAWVAAATIPSENKPVLYSQYQAPSGQPDSFQATILQCTELRWDGDIESKQERNQATQLEYIARHNGFNIITPAGIKYLLDNKLIQP